MSIHQARSDPQWVPIKQAKKPVSVGYSTAARDAFYLSWEWGRLRMEVLKKFGRRCQCCGAAPGMLDVAGNPVRIVVDHIKPLSKYGAAAGKGQHANPM